MRWILPVVQDGAEWEAYPLTRWSNLCSDRGVNHPSLDWPATSCRPEMCRTGLPTFDKLTTGFSLDAGIRIEARDRKDSKPRARA